jgi:nitrite reductase/ring-hydroxylating ferredoxin subunit
VPRFCPHRGGRLDHGFINPQRKTVACPLHHSVFSLVDGQQLAGPACGRLAVSVEPTSADAAAPDTVER